MEVFGESIDMNNIHEDFSLNNGQYPPFIKIAAIWLSVSAVSFAIANSHYLLFHTAAEIFSIVVAMMICVIASKTYRYSKSNFMLFLGYAYFFIAVIDFFHTLTYKGLGVFQNIDANTPTQLWIAGRYVESFSLFLAPFFIQRRLPRITVLGSYILTTSLFIASIMLTQFFPACFIEGVGLTRFKIASEYIICFILLLAIGHLYLQKERLNKHLYNTLTAALIVTIISELCFTLYIDVYGFMNFAGHVFKILSSYLIYRGIVLRGLEMPYDIIFKELKDSKEQYRDWHQQLFNIIDFLPDATFVIDKEKRVIAWNKAIEKMTGVKKSEIIGLGDRAYSMPFYGKKKPFLLEYALTKDEDLDLDYENIFVDGNTIYAEDYIPFMHEGTGAYLWHIAAPLFDRKNNLIGAIETLRDITKRKQIEEKFKTLSTIDGLTGIANRRLFEDRFNHEWERAKRDTRPLSLIICDIDYFKLYNDNYGHLEGDICLKKVANVLQETLKRTGDLVARYGGEEFAVILPETDLKGAVFVAEKLRTDVEALGIKHEFSNVSNYLTISLGVATTVPKPGIDASQLLDLADRVLYRAKGEGRNRTVSAEL